MHRRKVIDMWAPVLPTREVMTHVADNYPQGPTRVPPRIFETRTEPGRLPKLRGATSERGFGTYRGSRHSWNHKGSHHRLR